MHFRNPPVESTHRFVESAPLAKLETGTRVVVEVVGYPDGQFRIVTSVVEGHAGQRTIRQHDVLMFRDSDEAKDALDLLVDRLGEASI